MTSLKEKIAEAERAMEKCFQHCSDYSCHRMGECTGAASKVLKELTVKPKLPN